MKLTLAEAKKMIAENQCNLSLSYSDYTELPDGLTIDNWLKLKGAQITKLPDGLLVSGGLDLSDTQIIKLPDNLTVSTWIKLSGTKITELPETLTLGGPPNFIIGGPIRGFHGDTSHVQYAAFLTLSISTNDKICQNPKQYYVHRIENIKDVFKLFPTLMIIE